MHIYIYIYYTHIYMNIYIYIHRVCVYINTYVCVFALTYVYTSIYIHEYIDKLCKAQMKICIYT